jgi:hypothetical protein
MDDLILPHRSCFSTQSSGKNSHKKANPKPAQTSDLQRRMHMIATSVTCIFLFTSFFQQKIETAIRLAAVCFDGF